MSRLTFDGAGVARCARHAVEAPEHFEDAGPSLWLVKDEGVYLMSNGKPADVIDGDRKRFVVYAHGFDPHKDQDVWNKSRDACGGDDFAETIELEGQLRQDALAAANLIVELDGGTMKVFAEVDLQTA